MNQKETIISRVKNSKRNTIFLPDSFSPIDVQYASNVLGQLVKDGILVRVCQGIYLKPEVTRFGTLMPSLYQIAEIIAKRDHAKILPCGPVAENYLGFSTQVPMNAVYITTGASRKLKIDNRTLTFKYGVPTKFAYKGKIMPILVLALQSIGKDDITDETLDVVYGVLKDHPEEATWQEDVKLAPIWIRKIIINTKERIKKNEQMG